MRYAATITLRQKEQKLLIAHERKNNWNHEGTSKTRQKYQIKK